MYGKSKSKSHSMGSGTNKGACIPSIPTKGYSKEIKNATNVRPQSK